MSQRLPFLTREFCLTLFQMYINKFLTVIYTYISKRFIFDQIL